MSSCEAVGVVEKPVIENDGARATSSDPQSAFTAPTTKEASLRPTVFRIKRRIEHSPSKALVVTCKRLKIDSGKAIGGLSEGDGATAEVDNDGDETSQYSLRLVGRFAEEEVDNVNIAATVKNVLATAAASEGSADKKVAYRRDVKSKASNIAEKTRDGFKRSTEESRFKIISRRRGLHFDSRTSNDGTEKERSWDEGKDFLKLLDLVPESDLEGPKKRSRPEGFEDGNVTCNGIPMVKESDDEKGFVYDLYVANGSCIEEFVGDQFVSVVEAEEEIDFGFYMDQDVDNQYVDDDEDSNAEDNWRNDYPDSEEEGLHDDGHGVAGSSSFMFYYDKGKEDSDDEDMYRKLKGLHMGVASSSDDEDLIYGIDDDGPGDGINFYSKTTASRIRLRQLRTGYTDEVVSGSSDSD